MEIHFKDLPDWARKEIEQAGKDGFVAINGTDGQLAVSAGTAYFNQKLVVYGSIKPKVEMQTINFADLPPWAQKKIMYTGNGTAQVMYQNATLQIHNGNATFNGKSVKQS